MRRIWTFFFLCFSTLAFSAHAYTANCSQMPGGSSCSQCFGFNLEQTNRPFDTFVPRPGLTAGQQEWVDISQSSISGTAFQGIVVGPTGNITNQFNLTDHGSGSSSWIWAMMKPGLSITRGTVPAGINYNSPAYLVKFVTKSNIKENGTISPDKGVTHTECAYYFIKAPATIACGNGIREGSEQCDDANTNDLDGCSNTCHFPVCGNGVREGSEQCDDGNFNNNDTCSNQCRAIVVDARCHVQVLESNGTVPLHTSLACSGQPLGRTVIAITKNNTVLGTFETNSTQYTFSQAGHYTIYCYPDGRNQTNACRTTVDVGAACGNGVTERGEQCDDGNTFSGDSCDKYCRLAGSTCGNGTLERGEECDDGNNDNGDYCTNICQSSTPDTGPFNIFWLIVGISTLLAGLVTYRKFLRNN